jgi:hypothetical protein
VIKKLKIDEEERVNCFVCKSVQVIKKYGVKCEC